MKQHILFRKSFDRTAVDENAPDFSWQTSYELVECAGCESVSMRQTDTFPSLGETSTKQYPPPVARSRRPWVDKLPRRLRTLLAQVYTALDTNSRSLALMGARAVFDVMLVDAIGDPGTFSVKLDALEKADLISKKNRTVLEAAIEAGNAAAHRGFDPTQQDLTTVMDILENVLEAHYHLGPAAARLKQNTPARAKKVESKKTDQL